MENIDYRDLPPGRKRALIYSLLVRNRMRLHIQQTQQVHQTQDRINRINRINISPIYVRYNVLRQHVYRPNIFRTFDFNTDYEDVKIGLINTNLLNFSKISINNMENLICVICQDDINKFDVIRTISCKHLFHIECIDRWFTENKKCPICKYILE